MKSAYLFSIALSLFLITFVSYPTRLDEAFKAFTAADTFAVGDIVLASGAAIVLGVIGSVVRAFKK